MLHEHRPAHDPGAEIGEIQDLRAAFFVLAGLTPWHRSRVLVAGMKVSYGPTA
jgi:hypothetical protein